MILQRGCHCWVQRGGRAGRGFVADHRLSSGLLVMEGWKREIGDGGRKKEEHYLPVHSRNWTCGRLMRERREIEPPQKCERVGRGGWRRVGRGGSHTILVTSLAPLCSFSCLSPCSQRTSANSPSYPDQENTQTPSQIYFWGSFSLLTSEPTYYLAYPVYCYRDTSSSWLAQLCFKICLLAVWNLLKLTEAQKTLIPSFTSCQEATNPFLWMSNCSFKWQKVILTEKIFCNQHCSQSFLTFTVESSAKLKLTSYSSESRWRKRLVFLDCYRKLLSLISWSSFLPPEIPSSCSGRGCV